MINWRSIIKDGYPSGHLHKTYLVTDGVEIATTNADIMKNYNTEETKFIRWVGDDNTYEVNSCCSGERIFDLIPTHWCPTDEINMPTN